MSSSSHQARKQEDENMKHRLTLASTAAVAAILALGGGLAAAQSPPASSAPAPATSAAPAANGTEAMNQMHEAMVAHMPEALRAESDAMRVQMSQANGGMAAMMKSMMGASAPPVRPGG